MYKYQWHDKDSKKKRQMNIKYRILYEHFFYINIYCMSFKMKKPPMDPASHDNRLISKNGGPVSSLPMIAISINVLKEDYRESN